MSLKAFLLCAGEGTRFRPHTLALPKSLIPFLNVPLCAYNLYLLKTLGVQHIIANTHAHPELLKKELPILAQQAGLSPPAFSFEEALLGSAGGLLKVKDFFIPKGYNYRASYKEKHLGRLTSQSQNFKGHQYKPEPFFYLNGDSFIWPKAEGSLSDFYSAHVKSGALASFLVRPADNMTIDSPCLSPLTSVESDSLQRGLKKSYIYAEEERVCSFSKPPEKTPKAKPYDFSGLALFSPQIFNKIEQVQIKSPALHIFKDVLNPLVFKEHLRVHSVPKITLLDMNQLSTYLQGTQIALHVLREQRRNPPRGQNPPQGQNLPREQNLPRGQNPPQSGKGFLQKVLDLYTPDWRRYEGDNWFSAEPVENPPPRPEDILFCGKGVRGLPHLSVKSFAVLGEKAVLANPLLIEKAVLGKNGHLKTTLQNTLKL